MRNTFHLAITLLLLAGCRLQSRNSFSSDSEVFAPAASEVALLSAGGSSGGAPAASFGKVRTLLKNNCVTCHDQHGSWANWTELQFVKEPRQKITKMSFHLKKVPVKGVQTRGLRIATQKTKKVITLENTPAGKKRKI